MAKPSHAGLANSFARPASQPLMSYPRILVGVSPSSPNLTLSSVACASTGEKPDQWRVFAFAERGIMARILGKDKSGESLASLFAAVRQCLESAATVRGLREETA